MHTTKSLTPSELAAEIANITGEPAPEPDTFCPGCGIAARGYCESCRERVRESARTDRAERHAPNPGFCYTPERCAGKTCCPHNPACTE